MGGASKDVGRLLNGLSLVAKELLKRGSQDLINHPHPPNSSGGEFLGSLITSSAKQLLLSATDLSGLTKGELREFSNPNDVAPSNPGQDTVVLFHHPPPIPPQPQPQPQQQQQQAMAMAMPIQSDSASERNVPSHKKFAFAVPGSVSGSGGEGKTDYRVAGVTPAATMVSSSPSTSTSFSHQPVMAKRQRKPRERRVPSTSFSRALGFAGLGAGLAWGTIQESAKRLVFGTPMSQDKQSVVSPFLSEKNAERLALALCRMRGAALKLGQMLSIQDESLVPAPILAALDIVRQGADVMPSKQLNQVLDAELGPDWSSKLTSFDYEPMAAASIGQVHRAVTKSGLKVAMKIQYPGVADSIDSDIENVKLLLDYTNLIPKGLFLDRAMKVAKEELSRECDYKLEAANQKRFRDLLSEKDGFYVPLVVDDISSRRVLTTELVSGIPIDKVALLDQKTRNYVGTKLLELTLMELFGFRFMQTDPNWSNFLYDDDSKTVNLIDFGAARDYPKKFVDDYLRMVLACGNCNREEVIEMSKRLGFLVGTESEIMLEAHVQAGFVVGLPFSKLGGYDFRSTNITQSISNLGATMLRHRLTPPPDEVYSLHRKLSGAFLACIKLGVVVPCRELLLKVQDEYQFDEDC